MSEPQKQWVSIQEKVRKGWIKTPLKKLRRHFNYSYIFSKPTEEE